jgi:hypothetical protein
VELTNVLLPERVWAFLEMTLKSLTHVSRDEWFLAAQRSAEHEVPRFVEREFRAFLGCGVLSRGLLRVHCGSCGMDP